MRAPSPGEPIGRQNEPVQNRPARHGAIVAAPDKFRGTATAPEIAGAIARAAQAIGLPCICKPMADGGEGTLEALGGANRSSLVTGPLGDPVRAGWRLSGSTAVIEMAQAAGLAIAGGAEANDPIAASTTGVGELVLEAVDAGARRVIVGVGGSASTDGGFGAIRAMYPLARLRGIDVVVACDVRTSFVDAATVFAPQKGATPSQVALLTRRLERLAGVYRDEYGCDVTALPRAGAAGGLAGGLAAALGAQLVDGFHLIADEVDLYGAIADAQLVVTGEGFLDAQSFDGKVVGGVVDLAAAAGVPVLAVVGDVYDGAESRIDAISLVRRFGAAPARDETLRCVEAAVTERLRSS